MASSPSAPAPPQPEPPPFKRVVVFVNVIAS
jgi:hypothetical protein